MLPNNSKPPNDTFWALTFRRKATGSFMQTIVSDDIMELADTVDNVRNDLDGVRLLLGLDESWILFGFAPLTGESADYCINMLTRFTKN